MKKFLLILLAVFSVLLFSQTQQKDYSSGKNPKIIKEIKKFQTNLNKEYHNKKETPLRGDNFTNFKQHPFFPIDLKYRITARFIKNNNPVPFDLPTSSGKTKTYQEYGKATFVLDGKTYTLSVFQSLDLMKTEKYKNHLFLPFRDETNQKETYGGGKYMDLVIPEGNTIILDFNQSYQPFCAYNAYDYSCPIVPEENKLPVEIRAGVMYEDIYHH